MDSDPSGKRKHMVVEDDVVNEDSASIMSKRVKQSMEEEEEDTDTVEMCVSEPDSLALVSVADLQSHSAVKKPRGRGLIGRLANHPTLLDTYTFLGEMRVKLKKLLLDLQLVFDYALTRSIEFFPLKHKRGAWHVSVKKIVCDVENLLEDIEFEDLATGRAAGSSMWSSSAWENLLVRQRMLDQDQHRYCGLPQVASIEDRTNEVLCRLEDVINSFDSLDLGAVCEGVEQLSIHDDDLDISRFSKPILYFDLPWYLRRCTAFCGYLLPYHFEKQIVVLLWVSLGFVLPVEGKELEDVASIYFDFLVLGGFISFDDNYPTCYKVTYKILQPLTHDPEFFGLGGFHGFKVTEPEKTRHLSIPGRFCNNSGLEDASECTGLLSLLLVDGHRCTVIDRASPYNLFLRLRYLRILDLSHSSFKHVPGHVCDLIHLRYLDLSYTRIKTLPSELSNLFRLWTLRLRSCFIGKFPDEFLHLVNLRHLDFDCRVTLISMPPYISRLTRLQTLREYMVSKHMGCSIAELGELNNLRGNLCISMLENVDSVEDAKQAKLHLKEFLDSLKLQWTCKETMVANFSVIQGLQPHYNLKKLEIRHFGGSQFPSWLSDPVFTNLVHVSLCWCKVKELPLLGHLPSIKHLELGGMPGIERVQDEFWRSDRTKISFPLLQTLNIYEMINLEHCHKLGSIPDWMISSQLTKLIIVDCPELQSLPDAEIPSTVKYLKLSSCPNLCNRYCRYGADWHKVAHVPDLNIDCC